MAMSAATSAPPPSMAQTHPQNMSRREGQAASRPSRTQSARAKPPTTAATPSVVRANSSHSRRRGADDVLPQQDHETTHAAQARRRSTDRPSHSRTNSGGSAHHRSSSRYRPVSDMAGSTAASNGGAGAGPAPVVTPLEQKAQGRQGRSRTVIPAQTGNWILGKTIGSGSMGKVKLARRAEGGEEVAVKIVPRGSTHDEVQNLSRADRERAEHSKEIRTAREAAIVTLLDHPYICGMRDVVRTSHHWYMLFEYVNGGQMLDYIISHVKLKEKQARKFSRQIASALDYCHRNSIVHRDLKIENILISKTGDIKIIDFGLSNLFLPRSHLRTFCGSLYFAAPELLQAKAYTGPEVDVWSFGIVLYVLVCGRVPFDDQSMQVLHAKIKKGVVDYPNWLTAECKHLISRMLVTDPKQRASLHEIINHPWMAKGCGAPPDNHLPLREPIQLPLDAAVIQAMTGFDFGAPELIRKQLTEVVLSDGYQRTIELALRERESQAPRDTEKKRGFNFDFYKRHSSTNSRDTLAVLPSEQAGSDPLNAYHPLISIYYLVQEKQRRDGQSSNPAAAGMPRSPNEAPLQLPEIAPPQAAHTNSNAYEMPGERPTGGRSRQRARTHGEDDAPESVQKAGGQTPSAGTGAQTENVKKESTTTNFLRRFSTRRRKEPSERPADRVRPVVNGRSPGDAPPSLRKSLSVRRTREKDRDAPSSNIRSGGSQPNHRDLLTPPQSAGDGRAGIIGRSTSVNSAEYRRRHVRNTVPRVTHEEAIESGGSGHSIASGTRTQEMAGDAEPAANAHPRSMSMRAKSMGHARRESLQARRARREEARETNVPEETDQELAENSDEVLRDQGDTAENVKPVFLKGLFSVSTTSTKPVATIRADIIRVLKQLNVEFGEMRGGFNCRHSPSIDLKRVVDVPAGTQNPQTPGTAHRRRISFPGFTFGGGASEREHEDYREVERVPQAQAAKAPPRRSNDRGSYSNSEASDDSLGQERNTTRRAAGETMTHVQSDLGGSMILKFEIHIVKIPLLSLHGIQFKRISGGTWQYKNMADQILKELRL